MKEIKVTDMFGVNKVDKTITCEASDLRDYGITPRELNSLVQIPPYDLREIKLLNPKTGIAKPFVYESFEWMNEKTKEEVGGWVYRNKELNWTLTIFND